MDIGRVAGYACYQVHDAKKHPARVLFKTRKYICGIISHLKYTLSQKGRIKSFPLYLNV